MRRDRAVRSAAVALAGGLALVTSSCSLVYVSGPPRMYQQMSFVECRGSLVAPVADVVLGLAHLAFYPSPLSLLHLPSAWYGFTRLSRCKKAQRELAMAIDQLAATPKGLRPDVTLESVAVALDQPSDTLRVGETVRARAAALTKAGAEIRGRSFVWSSSNTAVITTDSLGGLSAKSPGSATIRAATGGMTGVRQVVVVP